MDIHKIIVLGREDLRPLHKPLTINQITLYDFDYSLEKKMMNRAKFIIFVESPNEYEILKNKHRNDSKETYALLDYLGLAHD